MSEIKAQILGIILTIGVFSIVFAVMSEGFKITSHDIQDKMQNAVTATYDEENNQTVFND